VNVRDNSANVLAAAVKLGAEKIAEFTELMADACKAETPVKSGHNKDSIDHSASGLEGKVWTESGYGGWLNVGTSRMSGDRYFERAFEQTKQELANA
jgi:HK97 gp10 family phage protein